MPDLRIELLRGPFADRVVERLRQLDESGWLAIEVVDRAGAAAFVIGNDSGDPAVDIVVDAGSPLDQQVEQLWRRRIEPLARFMAGVTKLPALRAVLRDHDPRFGVIAARLLARTRDELLRRGVDAASWTFDHIGSTSVHDLQAKPYVDLQIGVDTLPQEGSEFDTVLAAVGYLPATGFRPDSPGVHHDSIKDPDLAPAEAYRKRLYVRPDPDSPSILHVRMLGSPWWSYTVLFRDWLRADPAGRRAYEATKIELAASHADDPDFDDYTRAKAAFFDNVQRDYENLGATSAYRLRGR